MSSNLRPYLVTNILYFYHNVFIPMKAKFHSINNTKFLCPASIDQVYIVFGPSICLSVCSFVWKNFYIGHIFWLVRVRTFKFHISIPCDKSFLLVSRSKSNIKVTIKKKEKMAVAGALVFHKHILLFMFSVKALTVDKIFLSNTKSSIYNLNPWMTSTMKAFENIGRKRKCNFSLSK